MPEAVMFFSFTYVVQWRSSTKSNSLLRNMILQLITLSFINDYYNNNFHRSQILSNFISVIHRSWEHQHYL